MEIQCREEIKRLVAGAAGRARVRAERKRTYRQYLVLRRQLESGECPDLDAAREFVEKTGLKAEIKDAFGTVYVHADPHPRLYFINGRYAGHAGQRIQLKPPSARPGLF